MFDSRRNYSAALAVLFLAACGTSPGTTDVVADAGNDNGSPDASGSDVAPTDTGVTDAGATDTAPEPDAPEPTDTGTTPDAIPPQDVPSEPDVPLDELEEACVAACEARQNPNMGGCPVSLEQDCADWCIDVGPNVEPELVEAYFECLATNPLCFQSMLQCVIGTAYPEPFAHTLTLRGSGYDAWEGERVFAAVEESPGEFLPAEGIVQEGAFELTFDVVMHVSQSHLTLFYIDANANRECDADADQTGSASLELWALPDDVIVLPEWLIEAAYNPETDAGFVCDFID
ncbi:MAG: hypothetical protein ACJAYU_003553 [Bradymonadia bacterium]|jgi:hypothetical protein